MRVWINYKRIAMLKLLFHFKIESAADITIVLKV